jgi:3-hydroxy-9,10-secoandrosta-1,3,5(10)-triene-9,17-dione monooxygenase
MLDEDSVAPTSEELISRARSLVPLLRENAVKAEQLRRIPDDSIRALNEAGMFRVAQLAHHGGYAADGATVAKVVEVLSSGCPSTVWVLAVYSTVGQLAEQLSEEALAEIHADPDSKLAGVFGATGAVLEPVDGGYRVRDGGRWPYNSGCRHATWDLLKVAIAEPDGTNTAAFAAIPMSDLTICDDWHVMGAMGTGSDTVTCGKLFIPEHRVGRSTTSDLRTLFRADWFTAFSVAHPLGMVQYALEAFIELAKSRPLTSLGYERMSDSPAVHTAITTAAVNIKMIEAYRDWALTTVDSGPSPEEAAIFPAGAAGCWRLASQAMETMFDLCRTDDIRLDRPIQRLVRDAQAFQHQGTISPPTSYELYGRKLTTT